MSRSAVQTATSKALARRFARGGHPVVIAGRNAQKLAATLDELKKSGATASSVIGDAAQAADARRFVAEAERLAPLAVAIHNAGSNEPGPFLEVSEERFTQHWREHAQRCTGLPPAIWSSFRFDASLGPGDL